MSARAELEDGADSRHLIDREDTHTRIIRIVHVVFDHVGSVAWTTVSELTRLVGAVGARRVCAIICRRTVTVSPDVAKSKPMAYFMRSGSTHVKGRLNVFGATKIPIPDHHTIRLCCGIVR